MDHSSGLAKESSVITLKVFDENILSRLYGIDGTSKYINPALCAQSAVVGRVCTSSLETAGASMDWALARGCTYAGENGIHACCAADVKVERKIERQKKMLNSVASY